MKSDKSKGKEREREQKKPWVPDDMDPVLEELPKWSLLAEVLKEIEEEMMRQESLGDSRLACEYIIFLRMVYDPRLMVRMHGVIVHPGSNSVVIMTSSRKRRRGGTRRSLRSIFRSVGRSTITLISEFSSTMERGCSASDARTEDGGIEVARVFGVEGETEWAEGRRAGGGWAT